MVLSASRTPKVLFRNRNYKVRSLQLINHLMLIPAIFYGHWSWWLGSVVVYFFMFCVGIDIGVHRLFSHRSFVASSRVQAFLGVCMTLASVGSTLAWGGMHRQHHKYSDTDLDPHSPVAGDSDAGRLFKTYLGIWKFYVARPEFTKDLRRSPLHRFLHYYYFLVIFAYAGVLFLIHPLAPIFLYCVPAVLSFHAASLIVTAGHTWGTRDFSTPDQSRNSIILHWLTWGEGLHNQHHAQPWAYRYYGNLANKWYYFDLPGFLIERVFMEKDATAMLLATAKAKARE